IKEFLSQCEKILDKMLTVTEITDLVWYNQGLGLSFDIVLMLIDYCKRVNKTSLAYISKVAINWWENEINTHQKARFNIIYLENLNARQSVIKKAFGIYNRKLSKKEAEYIQTWYDVFKYDITIIEKAYETCVDTTGKVSFPYINKTLTVWFNSNLKTVEEIEQFNIEHKQEQQKQYSENSIKKAKKSQLGAKFEQSSIDYDELQNFLNKNI
ncbi:MAG: DnaD domain protein, partial [Oscillospiraceae bacterium]